MATIMHNQLDPMTLAQSAALLPHLKLQHSDRIANEVLSNGQPLSDQMIRNTGLGNLNPIQALQVLQGNFHTRQPAQPKYQFNSWMVLRLTYTREFPRMPE